MAKLISHKYPLLRVHAGDANVKFRDGVAVVSDEVAADLLALDIGIEQAPEDDTVSSEDGAEPAGEAESDDGVAVVSDADAKRKPGRPRKAE